MTSAAITEDDPQGRARQALGVAFGIAAPEAIALRDGTFRLRHSRERFARKMLRRLERRLARRAGDIADDRLVAEAVALVGAEVDRVRGGSRADGATRALDTLLDLPGLPESQRAETQALLQDVLDGNQLTTDADLRRLTNVRARRHSPGRPLATDLIAESQSLTRDAERLLRPPAPPVEPPAATPGTPPRGLSGWVRRLVQESRSAADGSREVRDRRAEAQYEEFRQLSREWRERSGSRPVEDIERDLETLSRAIRRGGHPAPRLPSAGVHVVVPDVQHGPDDSFRAHVRRQIADLESAATDQAHRADVRTRSAETAGDQAAELFAAADRQAASQDASAYERARRIRTQGVRRLRVAERHAQIAQYCTAAADQARVAADAYRTLLESDDLPQAAQAAAEQVQAYQKASAATLPAEGVLHNGLPSGRLPHLTRLCRELNQALADRKSPYSFTPDVLHRTLRAESRRILSPDGFVLTIGNEPRADIDGLIQFHLKLDPGELQEVLDSPLTIDEAQVGQVVQGGYNVATSAMQTSGATIGADLRVMTEALPDTSKLKAVAKVVSPGVESATGRGLTVSGGATEYAQSGAVEALRGEILRYRSAQPRWSWRIRESAAGEWSPVQVVDSGAEHDTATLDLGYIHTYTVPPPADQTDLETLGLSAERSTAMPEHMATRVDGLNDLCDRTVAELRRRLGSLDRVGHDRIRSLVAEDAMTRLDETTRLGGVWRLITNGGRPVAWAQLETVAELETAELVSDSSPDHKLEIWRVGNSGTSGAQGFSNSRTLSATATTALSDVGSSTVDVAPGVRAGRNTGQEDTASTADLGSRWSTQRVAPTVGVKLRLRHKVTVHRLDREESFSTEGQGDAYLRMAERDAFRYGLPVPAAALVREDGRLRRGTDGRVLLRGDPHPTDIPLRLPVWLGNGPGQLRGAGPAMIRELTGADEALQGFLAHLSRQSMVPPLSDGHPLPHGLAGEDPAVVLSRTENWERACQQLARHRLETGYDHAAQDRLTFQLTEHRTGHPPRVRSYRIAIEQHFDRATPIGVADDDMVVNVDIGVSTSGRSSTQSRSLPWSASLGVSNAPADGQSGSTPQARASVGRSSMGRSLTSSSSRGAYRMTVSESSAQVAVFDVPHTITISEITDDGESVPIVTSEGSARVCLDSEFCAGPEQPAPAVRDRVDPGLLQTATVQHVDARDPIGRLVEAVPELGRGDSSALHHLSAFLAPRNLISRPELLTTEYRTGLAVSPAPSDALEAVRRRGLSPRRTALSVTTRVENLRYVGSGHPILAELNVTLASTGSTSGVSTGATAGVSAGTGSVSADGNARSGSVGLNRSTTVSSSGSETTTSGIERTLMRDGQHYQFWGDLVLEAQLRSGSTAVRAIPLETGAVVLTLPEGDALRAYGRNELDLPLHQVSDAVERLLDGNLELPRRTTTALLRRYRIEKAGADGLAATHTDERLANKLREATGLAAPHTTGLDAALAEAEVLARLRVEVPMPRNYEQMLGAAQVDRSSLQDQDGNDSDPFREVCATVAEHSPQALDDAVLTSALRGDLSGTRWRNQLDEMLDPRGFVRELPIRDGAGTRNLRVRVKVRFVGPVTTEAGGTEGQSGNGYGLQQLWSLRDRTRSVTEGTSYSGQVGVSATEGASATIGAGAELATSTTSSSSELNTRISTGLSLSTVRIERDYQVVIEVEDSAEPGGRPRAVTRREASGRISLSVPASVLHSAPAQDGPEVADHRAVRLPDNYLVDGTLPHQPDAPAENALFDAVVARLSRPDLLRSDGVRMHQTTLESLLGAANRAVAFQEMAGPSGHELVPLAIPGQTSRVVAVRIRAEVSGLELISDPDEDSTTQLGENSRELRVSQLTARSNRLLPGSRSIGGTLPGGAVTVGLNSGRRVGEQDTGTVGARHETGVYESGQVVTVKVSVDYHLDFERRRIDRHHRPKVERSDSVHRAASGEAYLTMFRHEYDAMRARMEAGEPALDGWDPTAQPKPARVRTVSMRVDADDQHPYQPLVDALGRARRDGVNVRLTIRDQGGKRQVYVAGPDGTLTSRSDSAFAEAFATLHPRLALLAEGVVDLRELHASTSGRFTGAVVDALQQNGIPASALVETDSRMRRTPAAHDPDGPPARRMHASNPGTGMTIE
ncbi:hypothetical protein [Kribbella pratensis]|uniref:Uncharacterized protein n=1 Tax=Kribbella pratensis TaxID=2512112 RepID=A0A4R8CJX7_9ACTN|nr:hypothetical protein [Kribbella pratensis]TDW76335.1 hypothetical protein EV653_1481 [Kribbella pratensis]